MKTAQEIKSAKRNIMNAIAELYRLYNDHETSFKEMVEIADFARVLDALDFTKAITN